MNNVIKFPGNRDKNQPQNQKASNGAGHVSGGTIRNIAHGAMSALYIVLVMLWTPVRFMLIANVVLQFFKMLFKWHESPFSAAWPFMASFAVLAVLTYIMATWKPKVL
jgi:hypothetical protein